jgi:hypothetical protein
LSLVPWKIAGLERDVEIIAASDQKDADNTNPGAVLHDLRAGSWVQNDRESAKCFIAPVKTAWAAHPGHEHRDLETYFAVINIWDSLFISSENRKEGLPNSSRRMQP